MAYPNGFNRRSNRVAGPGFHVNVRYDDVHVDYSRNNLNSGNTGKVPSPLDQGLRLPELFDIKEQELLVTKNQEENYASAFGDGYTHCFSCANGYYLDNYTGTTNAELEAAILSKVKYVGVANTEYVPTKGYEQQGFVAQVGGVTTLLNESSETIYPGDTLMLGLDLAYSRKVNRDKGIPREKIRFCLRKAKPLEDMVTQAIANAACGGPAAGCTTELTNLKTAIALPNKSPTDKAARDTALKTAQIALTAKINTAGTDASDVVKIMREYQKIADRIIGKSFSYARPGDRLEVGLQPRNAF
jgi:hypothetical protein